MQGMSRRLFAKWSAAIAATTLGPVGAGRQLRGDATPPDGAARPRLAGGAQSRPPAASDDTLQAEFLMDLRLQTQPAHEIGGAGATRRVVPVSGGSFQGPRLRGSVIAPGGDWMVQRPDGSRVLDVRILLRTDDTQIIYVSWRGIAYPTPGGGLFARILPVFETGAPAYTWLNNVVAVGVYRGPGIAYRLYRIL